jgi:hypothetical protein
MIMYFHIIWGAAKKRERRRRGATEEKSGWELKGFRDGIEIQCNCLSILFAIWACNCERVLVGPTFLGRCSDSPRTTRAGSPHEGPPHNCLPRSVGEWQKMVYADKKRKSFYTLWMLFSLVNWKHFRLTNILCHTKH